MARRGPHPEAFVTGIEAETVEQPESIRRWNTVVAAATGSNHIMAK